MKKNILIICRKLKDLKLVDKAILSTQANFVVATDSIEIQNIVKKKYPFIMLTFIEQMDTIFSIAGDVLKIRKAINEWLVNQAIDIPANLMKWEKWSEGGSTTQKIQDTLLLINSYLYIFEKFNISIITLNRSIATYWEDNILLEAAKAMGITIITKINIHFLISRFIDIDNIVTKRIKIFQRKIFNLYIPNFLAIKSKQIYFIFTLLLFRVINSKNMSKVHKNEVTFLLGSSANKDVENIIVVMKQFMKKKDYKPIAICWGASGGCKKIKKSGLQALNLESWFDFSKINTTYNGYSQTISSCRVHLHELDKISTLKYRNINLSKILKPYVIRFLKVKLLHRIFLNIASNNYLNYHIPVAVKTWGENVLEYGQIFNYVLNQKFSKMSKIKPLIFHYPVGITIENPYSDSIDKPDLLFISGKIDKEICMKYLNNYTKIIVSGFGKSSNIQEFQKVTSVEKSKRYLKISNLIEYNIFYISSGILRGYISCKEHVDLACSLINFVLSHKKVSLIIKPHPSEDESFWIDIIKSYDNPNNVYLFDRKINPYHCINISDIVITKFSTLALEAMEFEKPVISVVLDGEKKFLDIFEDGVEKFTDVESLVLFMEDIILDSAKFERWKERRLIAQKEFLPKKMHKPKESVEKIIVDNVIEGIEKIIQ